LAIVGVFVLFVNTYLTFRYTRVGRNLLNPKIQELPKKAATIRILQIGLVLALFGIFVNILGAVVTVGLLVAKSVALPPGVAITDPKSSIRALDVFVEVANVNGIAAHFVGVVGTLWLLNKAQVWEQEGSVPPSVTPLEKPEAVPSVTAMGSDTSELVPAEELVAAMSNGEEKDLQQGLANLLLRQLGRRLGEMDPTLIEEIRGLSPQQLEVLGEKVWDFSEVADLQAWVEQQRLQPGEIAVILRQLTRRLGQIEPMVVEKVRSLPVERLEVLGEALLDFSGMTDLMNWLQLQAE
jgi:hypothetical protein